MADPDALKNTRTLLKGQFTRSEKKLRDGLDIVVDANKLPITTIKRRFDDIQDKWTKAQDAHDAYVAALGLNETDRAVQDAWINEISARFEVLGFGETTPSLVSKQFLATG